MQRFQTYSPADGSLLFEREFASAAQVEATLQQASQARQLWRSSSLAERKALCEAVVTYLEARATALGEELSWQMGRPVRYTPNEILRGFRERARYMVGLAEEALQPVHPVPVAGFNRFIRREPLGTVLVLAPWNYPYLTAVNAIIPAILSGNAVILKHAQQTALVAERFAEAFEAAGAPRGLFQMLHLSHPQVADVIADPRIDFVAFTGSVPGGQAIQQAVSSRFVIAGLELGGKDPAYVREDADLADAVENLVDGAFFNSGQSCCGIERIYVHQSLFDRFVEGFVDLTNTYQLGHPLDPASTLGPMVRSSAADLVRQQIEEAISLGARPLIDQSHFSAHQPGTPYLAPQVLFDVDHRMAVMTEESFGPVVGIMPVSSDEEAIRLMNDSRYGLTASVWTRDPEAALAIGDHIETGTLFMNRCDYLDPGLAWTGVKDSGRGCTLSALGFEALTRPKSFHLRLG